MRVRDVFAIYDNNISPGLLMIIIKIIIIYFIQIRHTDDFPPTGTPASDNNIGNELLQPLGMDSVFTDRLQTTIQRDFSTTCTTVPSLVG